MKNKQWLISWIGKADHDASEQGEASGLGPIATALQAGLQFDRVCLLTNFPHERSAKFCEWLEKKSFESQHSQLLVHTTTPSFCKV